MLTIPQEVRIMQRISTAPIFFICAALREAAGSVPVRQRFSGLRQAVLPEQALRRSRSCGNRSGVQESGSVRGAALHAPCL